VNGQTVYEFQYLFSAPDFSYTHTDVVDSVSLEFDQLGRRMLAFEAAGDINLLFFDTLVGAQVVTNYGAGYNPFIVTDTYRRTGGSADSERLLFYVDNTTKQIVYRRQLDRFTIKYTLPDAPQDVVELIKVSKNIYGGITALYCYEESPGVLTTGSFTALLSSEELALGTDGEIGGIVSLETNTAFLENFSIAVKRLQVSANDSTSLQQSSSTLNSFSIESSLVNTASSSSTSFGLITAGLQDFLLESSVTPVNLSEQTDATNALVVSDAALLGFSLKVIKITFSAVPDTTVTLANTSASLNNFELG